MANEKRVKLGVDIGALSQELLQVNRLVEENYKKSIKGQEDYNSILEESIELLKKQAELVSQLEKNDLQNFVVGGGNRNFDNGNSPLHVIVDNISQLENSRGGNSFVNIPIPQTEILKGDSIINSNKEKGSNNTNLDSDSTENNENSSPNSIVNTSREESANNTSIPNNKNNEISISEIRRLLILIDKAKGTNNSQNHQEEALDNETEAKENDILKNIQEDLDKIWEKLSEGITSPIPVLIASGLGSGLSASAANGGVSNLGVNPSDSIPGEGENQNGSISANGGGGGGRGTINRGGNAFNQAAGLVQQDPNYVLAGLVGMVPVIGMGLASVATKLIQEAEQRDIARSRFRAATGGNAGYGSFVNIGLKDAEAFDKLSGYYPSSVYLKRSDIEFEKGFNVSSGTISSLLRAFREDIVREFGASVVGVEYLRGLSEEYGRGGINWKEIRGYSEDYLKILIELNQKQLETTGETNSLINSHIVQGIASLDKKFGDPTILARVVEGIENGLTQARSPQVEALQYYSLSQANPGASIWEMQLMKENPFGIESRGYFSNFLENLLRTGNIQDAKFNIMNAFGLSAHQTEYLVNGILRAREENEKKYQDSDGNFSLIKYLESKDFGELTMTSSRTTHRITTTPSVDKRYVEEVVPELLRAAGLNIIVASGYRPGAKTIDGKPSRHGSHEAVDIVPGKGTTYEDIRREIYTNPDIYSYFLANGIGLIDETSATGTTKYWHDHNRDHSHFHFGKDSKYAAQYKKEMEERGITSGTQTTEYTEYEEKVGGSLSSASQMISSEAAAATTDFQQSIAKISNTMADFGEPLIRLTSKSIDFVEEAVSKIQKYFNGESIVDDIKKGVEELGDKLKNTTVGSSIIESDRRAREMVNETDPTNPNDRFENPSPYVSGHHIR